MSETFVGIDVGGTNVKIGLFCAGALASFLAASDCSWGSAAV